MAMVSLLFYISSNVDPSDVEAGIIRYIDIMAIAPCVAKQSLLT